MSHIEEALLRRYSVPQFILFGVALACVGVLPLSLHIAVGPDIGNPLVMGLFALAAVSTGVMCALAGLVKLLVRQLGAMQE